MALMHFISGGGYMYKRNLSSRQINTYCGTIERKMSKREYKHWFWKFRKYENQQCYLIKFLCWKIKIKKRVSQIKSCPLEINEATKCLMVCPHPDDEILGAGALMIKYSNNFDCLCMASSGVDIDLVIAEQKAEKRINDFYKVMDYIGVKNKWIFKTYGIGMMYEQLDSHFQNYCSVLDLEKYDYIFLPHPKDKHKEHKYITNNLFKKIIKAKKYNVNTKIVFYEVWSDIKNPNVFFDTENGGILYSKHSIKNVQKSYSKLINNNNSNLLDLKLEVCKMYNINPYNVYSIRKKCLNNGNKPIWKFKVTKITNYLNQNF